MKHFNLLCIVLFLASCNNTLKPYYQTVEIKNTPYVVDVPANMYTYSSESKILKLFRDESATGLIIMCTSMSVNEFQDRARQEIKDAKQKYSVTIHESSDSLIWYGFSKGKVTGNCVFSLRKSPYINSVLTNEKIFIWYHGLGVNMEKARTIINSVRVNIKNTNNAEAITKKDSFKKYSNDNFSVSYPYEWTYIIEHPTDMTEVIIRSEKEDAGISIVRIETEETLETLVQMAIESNDNLHLKTSEPEKVIISNCIAYKYETSGVFVNDSVKHIAYSLKKDNMFYNLRIGMSPIWINTHLSTIDSIATSFKIFD